MDKLIEMFKEVLRVAFLWNVEGSSAEPDEAFVVAETDSIWRIADQIEHSTEPTTLKLRFTDRDGRILRLEAEMYVVRAESKD